MSRLSETISVNLLIIYVTMTSFIHQIRHFNSNTVIITMVTHVMIS